MRKLMYVAAAIVGVGFTGYAIGTYMRGLWIYTFGFGMAIIWVILATAFFMALVKKK